MELDSVTEWLSWPFLVVLVNPPGLVLSIVAVPEGELSVVSVRSTVNIKTFLSVVSDVSL